MSHLVSARRRPPSRTETIVAIVALAVLTVVLASIKVLHVSTYQGDTALYFQLTHNIAERGEPVSSAYTNIQTFVKGRSVTMPATEFATSPFTPPPPGEEGNVLFTLHSYYIMYPIGLLAKIFPVPPLLMTIFAISFVGLIGLAYFALRRKQVGVAAALLFCAIVVAHPAWWASLLDGQFYPDRLFVLLGFVFMYLATRDDVPRSALIGAAVLASLVIERAPLTAGLFLLAYVALYWKRPTLDRYFKLGLGAALVLYGIFLIKFGLTNPTYSSFLPTSLAQVVALFHDPAFVQRTILFLIVNATLLAIASFEWRAAAIAAFLMLPNIFGNIGGAEKLGWSTHYHSFYFPALVWAAMLGYSVAYKRLSAMHWKPVFYAGGALAVLILSIIDPTTIPPLHASFANVANNPILRIPREAATYLGAGGGASHAAGLALGAAIPANATVTTPEGAMSFVYDKKQMYFFPVGIDTADYAVLSYTAVPGQARPIYSGALTFLPDQRKQIDAILTARMQRDGYDLDHPTLFPQFSLAVIKRYHNGAKPPAGAPLATATTRVPTPAPTPTIPPPLAIAAIAQHATTVASGGVAAPTDLTGKLPKRPANGHIVLAFGSTGFGCKVAPGWTLLGSTDGALAAIAYHVVVAGDTSSFVPFTTATANGYALDLIEVDGGPDIVASPQIGGGYMLSTQVTNTTSLDIPQKSGVLFGFDAAYTHGGATGDAVVLPAGQKQILVDRIPHAGNAAGLTAQATTTDPFLAKQPFASERIVTFTSKAPPGNIVLSWLVWVGGRR